jgi:hypothetical protein
LPICLFSMEGYKGTRLELSIHNNVLTYSVHPHSGNTDFHTFTDVHFEEGCWYHVAIAHYIVAVPLSPKVWNEEREGGRKREEEERGRKREGGREREEERGRKREGGRGRGRERERGSIGVLFAICAVA